MRECGECTLCCELTRVPELNKPEGKLCVNCSIECNIYDKRPQSCRDFQCAWSLGDMSESERPDKVGFMIERLPNENVVLVLAKNPNVLINQSFNEYLDRGVSVVSTNGFGLIADGTTPSEVRQAVIESAKVMKVI